MSISRQVRRRNERELAKRMKRTHSHTPDESFRVIHNAVLEFQSAYADEGEHCCEDHFRYIKNSLELTEKMHRNALERSVCDDCLEEFKQKKFYVLDEAGFEYSAEGLALKREILAS